MPRLILAVLIVYLFYSLFRAYRINREKRSRAQPQASGDADEMVLDPQCQSYVPKKDAVARAGLYFCSEDCAKRYRYAQPG